MLTTADPDHALRGDDAVGHRPRIALFSGAYNHIADGVTRTLNRLVGHLEATGFDVRVFAPTSASPQVDHVGTLIPVPSTAIPGRPDYRLSLGLRRDARHELERFDPDIYHIATPDFLGLQALLHARRRSKPVTASYHTHFASYLPYYRLGRLEPLVWAYLRWFYAQCVDVYVPSESMIEVLNNQRLDGNLQLWERGVETDLFTPAARSQSWRRELGIDDNDVVIAFVSRLVLEKGLRRMIDILQALEKRGARYRILIVGDGPAREELERELPGAVFAGYLEGSDLARAYASSDLFLFPSDTETFGNATLEAMASGLPVVCAEATGNKTLVSEGKTGFRIPADQTDRFVDTLALLLDDPDLRATLGSAGFAAAQHYSWPQVLDKIVGFYRIVLSERGPARRPAPLLFSQSN